MNLSIELSNSIIPHEIGIEISKYQRKRLIKDASI